MFNVSRVIIVGGGFAGLSCAKVLAGSPEFSVLLIDRLDYHQFQPLLYQVATGALSPQHAAFNLRVEFSGHDNVEVQTTEIVSVDLQRLLVRDKEGREYRGDYLVLAAGNEANFFGVKGAEQFSFPIYSLVDAERLRARLYKLLEDAALGCSNVEQNSPSIVVVGGGPTGVEVAGAIQDILRLTPAHTFAGLDLSSVRVTLVNSGASILQPFAAESQEYAERVLKERGVTLRIGSTVQEVTPDCVRLSDDGAINADLVIWAGGLKSSGLSSAIPAERGPGGRVTVNDNLTVPGYPRVYALGDFANVKDQAGVALPQLAAVAQQAGRYCGRAIVADAKRQDIERFAYHDKGILAMIGRNAAISELGSHHHPVNGPFAFVTWLGVHAALLADLRAETEAIFEWVVDYARGVPMNPLRIESEDTSRHVS